MLMLLASLVAGEASAQVMSVDDVVARAVAQSPEVRALEAAVAEARASAALGDAFRSSASLSATPGYASGLPIAVLGQVPAIGSIEAHRLLYDSSARADQLEAASEIDAAIARLESRKREIAQNAADLYARVAAGATLADSAQRRVTAYETIVSRTEALRREGRVRELDADRAALQLAIARRRALQTQTALDLDRLRLVRLVGQPADVTLTPSEARWKALVDRDPSLSLRMSEQTDPELRSLDARIDALQRALGLEQHLIRPSVAAQIQYSRLFDRYRRYYLNFKPDDFSVGATVTLPVWTSGRRSAIAARLSARLQGLIAQRDARRIELEIAVREAEAEVIQAGEERTLAQRAQTVAKESLRVAEELAREGRGEVNDVPTAQIALADADDELANASAHVLSAGARLSMLRGDLPKK